MITININKAKNICHDARRAKREAEFAPLDALIAKKIPGHSEATLEAERQVIRDKYASIQTKIDRAESIDSLKEIIGSM